MNIVHPESIEDHILVTLQKGVLPIVMLIEKIKQERPGTTKQGVYLIIKRLKKQEIVVVHNKNVSLSTVWLSALDKFVSDAEYNTKHTTSAGNSFLDLKQGEKLQYYFKNPILTDAFWSHVFLTLVETSSPLSPILLYNPHEWFLLTRTENETELFKKITDRSQKLAVLSGNKTFLDKYVRKYFDGTKSMYETPDDMPFPKNNYYINIIGDFIIEVWLDRKIADQLDKFYTDVTQFNDIEKHRLESILMQKGKNRFSITNNKRKADTLRRKFKKYFFL